MSETGTSRIGRLWAGWRRAYVSKETRNPSPKHGSVFEDFFLSDQTAQEIFVLWEGKTCAVMLNIYPYVSGHLLVLPKRAVPSLQDLSYEESGELWELVNDAVSAISDTYMPDGINVGINIGKAAGASIPEHLHVHCLPRWNGDTTFLTSVAETRMIPETLSSTYENLKKNWPAKI